MSFPFLGRTKIIFGEKAVDLLANRCVAVFGLGGVGGFCIEALVRSGIGKIVLIDSDVITLSNINRQIFANSENIGMKKTEAALIRLSQINPKLSIVCHNIYFDQSTKNEVDFSSIDYIVDAIDSINSKLLLAECAREFSVPIISSMGTANKIDPQKLKIGDIFETSVDPLSRLMRSGLRKKNISALKVVFSTETPILKTEVLPESVQAEKENNNKIKILGSNAFVPSTAGILIAKEVVCDLIYSGEK